MKKSTINSDQLASVIVQNKELIFNNLKVESIIVSKFINETFTKEIDQKSSHLFKFVFKNFYRLESAGLTDEFKEEYFKILDENKKHQIRDELRINKETLIDIVSAIANRLNQFKTKKSLESFQFSFISKLLNTINNNIPIWDSEVKKVFKLPDILSKRNDLNSRVTDALNKLYYIHTCYSEVLKNKEIQFVLGEFDKKYSENNLSEVKKLDFIVWVLGKNIKSLI